uniref:PiggyBac transposable element-derived protein domain-containing protein n=1 Tax=Clastoptera arizonana TaxID=38151 RepID=A0A1B6C839_9HEMI
MGGVDLRDQILHNILLERKLGVKWHIKLFKRLLNMSILKSYIIWKSGNPNCGHLQFKLHLIKEIIHTYKTEGDMLVYGRPSIEPRLARLTKIHFIDHIPLTEKRPTRKVCSM